MHVQILKFHSGPLEDVAAYSTLGLGRHRLISPSSGKPIRLELLMMVRRGDFERFIPSLLQQLADESIDEGRALLRGDVIGSRGVLDANTSLEAMYVCAPVYQPDEFSICEEPDGPVVIAWLIPLFAEDTQGCSSGQTTRDLYACPNHSSWLSPGSDHRRAHDVQDVAMLDLQPYLH